MSVSRKTLAIVRDEFQAASRQGPKLFHAMYRFSRVAQVQPNNVPPHCGGLSIRALLDGFEAAFYYREPGATFCRTQVTEFFRLAEAAVRCIDLSVLPTYPPEDGVHLRGLLESPGDPGSQWLSAVYRLAWKHTGPLLRAEPSINGKWVGAELLSAHHLLDECTGGATWEVCVALSPDVFLASALAIDLLLETPEHHFMEMAIGEARKCVGEDDRAHPKVGAVVVQDGVVLASAFRGELGKGEHAEYTALEKKLPDATLAGATVYATLEPCTTRNHPKTACAQRLIDRRVKRVVIGMLDPNPRICGKGERLLRDHGIEVERFPHELVMKLEELNRAFAKAQGQADITLPERWPQRASDPLAGLLDQRFSKWHEKRLDALDMIYNAFCDYLDFLRVALYVKHTRMNMDPMHTFHNIIERQIVYLADETVEKVQRYQGELLSFWNWAQESLDKEGEAARPKIQERLDTEIPAYLPRLRQDINEVVAIST
ncbi:MAG: deaminase [Gemmataceae bacterium]